MDATKLRRLTALAMNPTEADYITDEPEPGRDEKAIKTEMKALDEVFGPEDPRSDPRLRMNPTDIVKLPMAERREILEKAAAIAVEPETPSAEQPAEKAEWPGEPIDFAAMPLEDRQALSILLRSKLVQSIEADTMRERTRQILKRLKTLDASARVLNVSTDDLADFFSLLASKPVIALGEDSVNDDLRRINSILNNYAKTRANKLRRGRLPKMYYLKDGRPPIDLEIWDAPWDEYCDRLKEDQPTK